MYYLLILFGLYSSCIDGHRFDYQFSQEAGGWLKLNRVPATWQNAYLNCHYEGGVLASPENKNMWSAMKSGIAGLSCGVYTGVHATFGKGAYFSVRGTPLDRMPIEWTSNEPDNAGNAEDCLIMLANGIMADVNCSKTFPYFCFIKETKDFNECGTDDNEYTLNRNTGSCYKVHRSPLNWTRAFVACAREGGYLAIVNSAEEAKTITSLWEAARPRFVPGKYNRDIMFLGFRNFEKHFLWMTIHGQTLAAAGYDRFGDGQPDQFNGGQDCGAMFRNGQLDDSNCENIQPFVCEKDPDSLLAQKSTKSISKFILYHVPHEDSLPLHLTN